MISDAHTSTEKTGRLFFKRTAAFFREDSDWGAGLLARAPKDIVHFLFADASNAEGCLSCRSETPQRKDANTRYNTLYTFIRRKTREQEKKE